MFVSFNLIDELLLFIFLSFFNYYYLLLLSHMRLLWDFHFLQFIHFVLRTWCFTLVPQFCKYFFSSVYCQANILTYTSMKKSSGIFVSIPFALCLLYISSCELTVHSCARRPSTIKKKINILCSFVFARQKVVSRQTFDVCAHITRWLQ